MISIQPPKGFQDFDPATKGRREALLSRIRSAYLQRGFDEIETPVAEDIDRLRNSDGGENVGMIFQIMRRGLSMESIRSSEQLDQLCDLGLRYDLTVPLARFYATHHAELPAVFRSIQIGPVWRAEKPQKGRYRQFTQCDIDIIGDGTILAELELILATLDALEELGIHNAVVRINDRRFLDAILDASGVPLDFRPKALVIIDKLDKIGQEAVNKMLTESLPQGTGERLSSLLDEIRGHCKTIDDVNLLAPCLPEAVIDHKQILSTVVSLRGAKSIRFDPFLVRGLGYYTGPIFEVEHPASKSSVAGGGRYDAMVGRFLGKSVPACGFSLGFDRLLELAGSLDSLQTKKSIALLFDEQVSMKDLLSRQERLLGDGYTVRPAKIPRNMKRLFRDLRRDGYSLMQRMTDPSTHVREVPVEERDDDSNGDPV